MHRNVFDDFIKFDLFRERIVIKNIVIDRGLTMEMYGGKIRTESCRS